MSALAELRLRFDLPSGNPAYFSLLSGLASRELHDALRHVARQCADDLDADDVRLLQHGEPRDRALAGAALLFLPASQPMLGKLWKGIERGERDALFLSLVAREIDPQFDGRAERLLGKLRRANARLRAGQALTEAAVAASPGLRACAALLAVLPEGPVRLRGEGGFPQGKAKSAREKFVAAAEAALRSVRPKVTAGS